MLVICCIQDITDLEIGQCKFFIYMEFSRNSRDEKFSDFVGTLC